MSWDQELENFKSKIDLREYAGSIGYSLDKRESWRGSAVMRAGGDKIVIKREGDGHYVYFSVRDDRDNGTIIDFVQFRKNITLGQVRKELRVWTGRGETIPVYAELEKTSKDRRAVETEYQKMEDAPAHPYLIEVRKIPAYVLATDRFVGRIRIYARNNAIFPHFDEEGLCGFESKNCGFTGFAAGGSKGLWLSQEMPKDRRLVLAEAAIDALSYAAIFSAQDARYASVGGQTNPKQPELIKAEILRMPAGAEIIAAMDNNAVGLELATMVGQAVILSRRSDVTFRVHVPEQDGRDWNDVLQGSSFPAALVGGGR
jgi:hypothetical protein